jgi:hypothetical protein
MWWNVIINEYLLATSEKIATITLNDCLACSGTIKLK